MSQIRLSHAVADPILNRRSCRNSSARLVYVTVLYAAPSCVSLFAVVVRKGKQTGTTSDLSAAGGRSGDGDEADFTKTPKHKLSLLILPVCYCCGRVGKTFFSTVAVSVFFIICTASHDRPLICSDHQENTRLFSLLPLRQRMSLSELCARHRCLDGVPRGKNGLKWA